MECGVAASFSFRLGGFSLCICEFVVFEHFAWHFPSDSECDTKAAQLDIMFDICNLAIVNYFRIELQKGGPRTGRATQEQIFSMPTRQQVTPKIIHIRQMFPYPDLAAVLSSFYTLAESIISLS